MFSIFVFVYLSKITSIKVFLILSSNLFFLKIKQKHLKVVALFEVLGWYMLLWNSLIY